MRLRIAKYQAWEAAIGRGDLAVRLFSAGLNLAEYRRGGMFVVLEDQRYVLQVVSGVDLVEAKPTGESGRQEPAPLPAAEHERNTGVDIEQRAIPRARS